MGLILRGQKGSRLTIEEMDNNLSYLENTDKNKYDKSEIDDMFSNLHVVSGNTITNSEDIIYSNNKLFEADYTSIGSEKSRVIVRKNTDFNSLQSQFNKENCIYEIRYEHDLFDEYLQIFTGCILYFNGGCLKNGSIVLYGNGVMSNGDYQIFKNIDNYLGNFSNLETNIKWFGAKGDGVADDSNAFVISTRVSKLVKLPVGEYLIANSIAVNNLNIYGASKESSIIKIKSNKSITASGISNVVIRNLSINGDFNKYQYSNFISGNLYTYFSTPVYKSYTSIESCLADIGTIVDGSDFIHTLDSGIFTVSLNDLANEVYRSIDSQPITLNVNDRYVSNVIDKIHNGYGGMVDIIYKLYDSSNNFIRCYSPGDSSSNYSIIREASKLTISLLFGRRSDSSTNTTAVINLNNLEILKLENEASSIDYITTNGGGGLILDLK